MLTGEYVKRKDECHTRLWTVMCENSELDPNGAFKIERAIGGIWLILEGIDYCWQESSFDVVTPISVDTEKDKCATIEAELVFS